MTSNVFFGSVIYRERRIGNLTSPTPSLAGCSLGPGEEPQGAERSGIPS